MSQENKAPQDVADTAAPAETAEVTPRRRGRPRKVVEAVSVDVAGSESTSLQKETPEKVKSDDKPRRRGRPRKVVEAVSVDVAESELTSLQKETPEKVKSDDKPRRRGRPRKIVSQDDASKDASLTADSKEDTQETTHEQPKRGRWKKGERSNNKRGRREDPEEKVSDEMDGVSLHLKEVSAKSPTELLELADSYDIDNAAGMRKQEQVSAILRAHGLRGGTIYSEGVLEILPDGFGFLRSPDANYLSGPDDVYVSGHQIRRFFLRKGDTVAGEIRPPRRGEKYFALKTVDTTNGESPEAARGLLIL